MQRKSANLSAQTCWMLNVEDVGNPTIGSIHSCSKPGSDLKFPRRHLGMRIRQSRDLAEHLTWPNTSGRTFYLRKTALRVTY
jgi:hypothetical protein